MQKYMVGTKFHNPGKDKSVCTVIDYLVTLNLADEIVKERYVAVHDFCGQPVVDNDVTELRITRGLIST
jgi:hypothetical protein